MINTVISKQFAENGCGLRRVRSFVRRQGRLTRGQQLALDSYWSLMGIDYQATVIEVNSIFGRTAPLVLEIGFGMGTSLVTMAADNPQQNFLGIEVHAPGVGACLAAAHEMGLKNLRVMRHDALEVLENMLPDSSLDRLQLFFPDPWPKARHNKRRIVQTAFAELVKNKLKVGGIFHMATDWHHYAEHMLEVMSNITGYHNLATNKRYVPRPDSRPLTKFELRGQRLGHGVWDLMFERKE
ncbi:tRNA (guanosine(46)-N7)-methyltransferase TrmB [Candidatus Fukatsuia endosymbiont of Tuberolachnus salignus]|uniref:tRNA (guanosine(46)-N7)-methyltransferase TrmB n=1 Tax=Candidatus Fukatsuia endosymbiont of Tuberolachnus salignus TaxID=3077957 RepID=UPI00313C64E8